MGFVVLVKKMSVLDSFLLQNTNAHKTSLTQPLFIEVPVPSQESERLCICVLGVLIMFLSIIFGLDFRTVLRT
jgi:hypothetical protein